jgi:transglutaminase-like putative cysteine protease
MQSKQTTIRWSSGLLFIILFSTFTSAVFLPTASAASRDLYSPDSTLRVEIKFTIAYTSKANDPTTFEIWISRYNNWSDTTTTDLKQIQTSYLKNLTVLNQAAIDTYIYDPEDVYGNSYDYFNKTMEGVLGDQNFDVQYIYDTTIQGFRWDVPESILLSTYDEGSSLYQFYTAAQPFCEADDPAIVGVVNGLKGEEKSVVKIAQAIYIYIIENMKYELAVQAVGAKAALAAKKGDCSEYSSLMVAMLRAAGIPARKVLGLAFVEGRIDQAQPRFDIKEGDQWEYNSMDPNKAYPGHAWVQYYVPSYGWITADPTWGQSLYANKMDPLQYFNRIDYLHLISTIGDYYGQGIDPKFTPADSSEGIAEFPFLYPLIYGPEGMKFDFQYKMEITVISADIGEIDNTPWWLEYLIYGLFLASGTAILIVVFVAYRNRKKSKRADFQRYR